jgi:hypothetical protein
MKNLHFPQDQITTILADVASGKEGMHQLLSMALEAMMQAERKLHKKVLSFFLFKGVCCGGSFNSMQIIPKGSHILF